MNDYTYRGYQGRRSGTGGGCGCGCNGEVKGPTPYQAGQSMMYQPVYQPTYQYGNQPTYPTAYQHANQPTYQTPIMNQLPAMSMLVEKPTPSPELLRLLEEAVSGETEDRIFYKQLIALAPTPAEKEIITGIRDDELHHFKVFRQIYHDLTGKEISPHAVKPSDEQPQSYMANLRKALFGEIAAVKKYRVIRSELSTKQHRDLLFNIITDELTHMGKYNYLITINKHNP